MSDKIKLFSLGGLDEEGKNLTVLEINDDIFILDAGIKYPDKNYPGVDCIIANFDYLKENAKKVKAYFISHAHDDQAGAIPFLYRKIPAPIYCSRVTAAMIQSKTEIYGLKNIKYDFHYISNNKEIIANREFNFIQMTHSVPGAYSVAIDTDQGYIIYTSDFIIDYGAYEEFKTNLNDLIALPNHKQVLLLITDSHSADKPGHCTPNHKLMPHINQLFTESTGRIFISIYTQNIFNYREILELCIKNNKKIVLLNDGFKKNFDNELMNYGCRIPRDNLININDIHHYAEKDLVFIIDGEGLSVYNYLISLANNNEISHLTFTPNDTFILACPSVAASETLSVEAIDTIYKTGAKVLNLTRKEIHSMHAHEEDLKMLISILHPKYYLPVKGLFTQLMANAKIALSLNMGYNHNNIFVLDNGMVLNLENGIAKADFSRDIPTGDVLVDGLGIGSVVDEVINERLSLSNDGVVILGCVVSSKQNKIISQIDAQMRGFVFLRNSESVVKKINTVFEEGIGNYLNNKNKSKDTIINDIKNEIIKFTKKELNKKPLIMINIVDLDDKNNR